MKQIIVHSKHGVKNIVFDDSDFDLLSKYRWHVLKGARTFYAVSNTGELMHKILIDSEFIDHTNCNGLDNRRSNLRVCNRQENNVNQRLSKNNKSGYKGVSFESARNKFVARLGVNYKTIIVGRFDTAEQAAKAYNEAAIMQYGQFAKLNVIPQERSLNTCLYQWTTIVQNKFLRI